MVISIDFLTYFNIIYDWVIINLLNIITTILTILIIVGVFRLVRREINRLRKRDLVDDNTALLFKRISRWTTYIVLGVLLFNLLGIRIDFFLGLWVLAGGTIVGFASMSTIGNALAGLIIMISRPFKIRDWLFFKEQFVVVEDIELIFTRMRTLDNIIISVPNQIVLETVISNQSVYNIIRRNISVSIDYSENPEKIRGILLESIKNVEGIIKDPMPYVWITDFPRFAMEYRLFYYINDTQKVQMIEAKTREAIANEFTKNGIEISTPNLQIQKRI